MNIEPLMGYILIDPVDAIAQVNGVYMPETAQEKPAEGKVLAVGADMVLEDGKVITCPVAVDDLVIYKRWAGDDIKVDGKDLKLVRFDDLMAKKKE